MISKDIVLKGLNCELNEEELLKIINYYQGDIEKYDYYDIDLYMMILNKASNKEIDFQYFASWCVLVMASLHRLEKKNRKRKEVELYNEIADYFDGVSFETDFNEYLLSEVKAKLKFYNHLMNNARYVRKDLFVSNNVGRYMLYDHYNPTLESDVYRILIIDYKNKRYSLKYFDTHNFIYKDDINYTFIGTNDEFENVLLDAIFDDEWIEDNKLKF